MKRAINEIVLADGVLYWIIAVPTGDNWTLVVIPNDGNRPTYSTAINGVDPMEEALRWIADLVVARAREAAV